MPPVDNSRHLAANAQERHLECVARVMAALEDARHDGSPATVSGIARSAGVSRTFLHDPAQKDLLDQIRELAAARGTGTASTVIPREERISAHSHAAVVRTLRDANSKLRLENDRLRDELARSLGELRDLRRGIPEPTRQD